MGWGETEDYLSQPRERTCHWVGGSSNDTLYFVASTSLAWGCNQLRNETYNPKSFLNCVTELTDTRTVMYTVKNVP